MAFALAVMSAATVICFLVVVPPKTTGLFAIFFDANRAAEAREHSLKLIPSKLVKYAYLFHIKVFAVVLIALVSMAWSKRFTLRQCGRTLVILILIFSVMLTGARSPGASLLLVVGVTFALRKGIYRGGIVLAGAALLALLAATLLTVFREGRASEISFEMLATYMGGGLWDRIFVVPFQTGVWTNLYAYEHGLRGVSNIRPLAELLGVKFENLPNLVGLAYAPGALESVSANTCFLFDYQASFGLKVGWLISGLLLCGVDLLLLAFRGLNGPLLVALVSAFMVSLLSLVSSAFTTCLLSHGILPIAGLAVGIRSLMRSRLASRELSLQLRGYCCYIKPQRHTYVASQF